MADEVVVAPAGETVDTPVIPVEGAVSTEPGFLGGEPPKAEDEGKPEGEVQAPEKDAKPTGAPEKYEFTPPEGMVLDPDGVSKFEPVARELNLSQEDANKLISLYAEQTMTSQKAHADAWVQRQESWKASVMEDKELGGSNLDSSLRDANLALTKFAKPEDIAEIKALGLANCPPLVKLLARAGKLMGEDTMQNGNVKAEVMTAKSMFPNSNMK